MLGTHNQLRVRRKDERKQVLRQQSAAQGRFNSEINRSLAEFGAGPMGLEMRRKESGQRVLHHSQEIDLELKTTKGTPQ